MVRGGREPESSRESMGKGIGSHRFGLLRGLGWVGGGRRAERESAFGIC